MARNGFALGVVLGGLTGVAVGYLLSRSGSASSEAPPASTIDLTPALERRAALATDGGDAAPAEAPRRRAEQE
ncbi:MAG TPA: hypothetical protein VG245_08880 [Candidatus Dormibacteraeota bacterium]|jgi:hypothetical protein|nr:hypothetical protein [Candidatus Dormibacteraeota bacterium]